MKPSSLANFAFAIMIVWVGPGLASTAVIRHVKVSYGDLDLAKPAGTATLRARIKAGARKACAPEPDFTSARVYADYSLCLQKSEKSALAAVPMPGRQRTASGGN